MRSNFEAYLHTVHHINKYIPQDLRLHQEVQHARDVRAEFMSSMVFFGDVEARVSGLPCLETHHMLHGEH